MERSPHSSAELLARASREPLGVDISDFSDEYCAGFLAGQVNALEESGLLEQLEALRQTLREIEAFIEGRHKEGDTEYQVALLARAVLYPAKRPT